MREQASRTERDGRQRLLSYRNMKTQLALQALADAFKERAPTRQDYPCVIDVSGDIRLRFFDGAAHARDDLRNHRLKRLAHFKASDLNGLGRAVRQVFADHFHKTLLERLVRLRSARRAQLFLNLFGGALA